MDLPEPQSRTFATLINDIDRGQIKIPQFQRDFVWTKKRSADLLDSVLKGYPVGTFIFWRTKEQLRAVKNIGRQNFPDAKEGEAVDYVLDGQQRLTSIYACLNGVTIQRDNEQEEDFSKIFIDLAASENEQIVLCDIEGNDTQNVISITDLLKGGLTLLAGYPQHHHAKIEYYKQRIESYQYSVIQVRDASIAVATEIFTRINVGGKPLTLFEIMVAKTYDHEKRFDLSEKFQALIKVLEPLGYETISDASVLQLISSILSSTKECKRQTILEIKKDDFIRSWSNVEEAIKSTVEYFRNTYRIPVSQLLPYNALVVPFAYFFYNHPDKPTGDKQHYLQDFFWRCALTGRYSTSVETKIAQDIKRIDYILAGRLPNYDSPIDTSVEFIRKNGYFNAGRSYIKAILCLLAYQQPKSFSDDALVNISNDWLKQANSKNYHHFFPRSFLSKKGIEDSLANNILNITIVDDFLNKRQIGAKAPSLYMKGFEEHNKNIANTMTTHLITDLKEFGIWEDDYDRFIAKRAEKISEEIEKRIIPQQIDEGKQPDIIDDILEQEAA